MSDAEIGLCFQYAAEDSPIDFRQMFPEKPAKRGETARKESLVSHCKKRFRKHSKKGESHAD